MKEVWKVIENYFDYEVSSWGRIRSYKFLGSGKALRKDPIILKGRLDSHGYHKVCLRQGKIEKDRAVHRLVAQTFIPNPNNYPIINHKNGIKSDNKIENLEWCTYKHNAKHAYKLGLQRAKKNHLGPNARLSKENALKVRELYATNEYSQAALAKKFNVSQGTISNIIRNKHYNY